LYTIRDVARLAEVSTATVSFVINGKGKGKVSEESVQRVLTAMNALDYHPNQVARSLRVRQTHTIGVVIPDVTNPFFGEVMMGIQDEARKLGYSVLFCNTNEDPDLERQHLDTLHARRVDGVLISSHILRPGEGRLVKRRCPMVFFDRTPPDFSGAAVVTDNLAASKEVVRHLIKLGHTRIAIITGPLNLSICAARLEGFRQALQEAVLPLSNEYLRYGDFKLDGGYHKGRELMQLPTPPTAIFCCNNKMTLGLMRALSELSIPCPERVSVVGFDDFEWVASFRPYLTTVAQPTYLMGQRATEMLVRMMQQGLTEPNDLMGRVVVLTNELRIRQSTAPPCSPLAVAGHLVRSSQE
jgi:LacI family transcriptional regulator